MKSMKKTTALVAALLLAPTLAACGSSKTADTNKTAFSSKLYDAKIAKTVPAKFKDAPQPLGVFNSFPPQNFVDGNGDLVGYDVDIARAVGKVLGVDFKLVGVPWDSIIPGMQSGRFVGTFSSLNPTPDRLKVLDAVSFSDTGSAFLTSESGKSIAKADDACGLTVASVSGSNQLAGVQQISDQCVKKGLPKIVLKAYPDGSAGVLALKSGRIDAFSESEVSLVYTAGQSNNQLKVQPYKFQDTPSGAGFPKGSGLAKPVAAALNKLIADGTYQKILDKWHVSDIAVKHVTVTTG